ncbi:hypothetical protein RHMOL_Rhmol06G0203900 [Rhododendron molle]|uniref:Uncharacterized protein n=1 Tax=Rhododendron molle TaxID=49168 RepID=A0ACC0NGF6_RHOML|nr:hypothetical protein RHMOL_Rhmol06G0203900 [Rhododendron molle]
MRKGSMCTMLMVKITRPLCADAIGFFIRMQLLKLTWTLEHIVLVHYRETQELNRVVTGPRHPGVIGDRGSGSISRESSSLTEWAQEANFHDWLDQHTFDTESFQEGKRWSSQPHNSSLHLSETKPLYRTSSYPLQPHQQQHFSSESSIQEGKRWSSQPQNNFKQNPNQSIQRA